MAESSNFTAGLLRRARALRRHVVLSEGDDERTRGAARALVKDGVADVTLLGGETTREWAAREAPGITVRVPATDPLLERVAVHLLARRPDKAGSIEQARILAADPLRFAASLVALGEADATVGGAVNTTGDVLRAAFWAVGPAAGIRTVSSSFYMVPEVNEVNEVKEGTLTSSHSPHSHHSPVLTFTDCGVVQYPTAEQLADIAVAASRDRKRIVGDEPRVAFLSHGTRGSAAGQSIDRVREGLKRFRAIAPDIPADGELQADAAIVPDVAARKAPDSPLRGGANVLVFPDLDSGNIAYKLVQRIGHAIALGPIVQGLARPCCDLSRGATLEDIVLVAAIAVLQSDV
jgi:phosphate acetyltransferase